MRRMIAFGIVMVIIMSLGGFAVFAGDFTYPEYTGKPVTITMWAWTSNENYSIEAFEKVYPNIHVEWENFGVHYSKVLTATAAGTGLPDVIMVEYTYAPQFMEYGSFQPINKWVSAETYKTLFPEASLKWCSLDGEIYGTPQDSGAIIMVYRKDILDKYGLKAPTTWDEFMQEAEKLHGQNLKIPFSSVPQNWVIWPLGMVWQAGGKMFDYADGKWYVDFTNPTAEKVFKHWGKLTDEGMVPIEMWWSSDWYNSLGAGQLATVLSGAWFPEWLRYNCPDSEGLWRVALPPQWDPENPYNGAIGGSGFYVSSQSNNPEVAALFVLWLNSHLESLTCLHDYSNLPVMVARDFEKLVLEIAGPDPFFGGQDITTLELKADKLIRTAYVSLPVMDYMQSNLQEELQKVIDGKQAFQNVLPNWEEAVIKFMKQQGFSNVVVDELP